MLKVLSIFGTRPEAIKMAPVLMQFGKRPDLFDSVVCVTAQHRDMLDQVLRTFSLHPDIDLDLMRENQDMTALAARAILALGEVMERVEPDAVLVQGDTITATAGALAAFYKRIPVGHVEAGLRTGNRSSPFPEEIDRRLVGVLASYHFAPTETAARALRAEGTPKESIFVTGNTVIDALVWTVARPASLETRRLLDRFGFEAPAGGAPAENGAPGTRRGKSQLVLVTAHRRENFGRPLEQISSALRAIVRRNPQVEVIYPVHPNPNVWEPVHRLLAGQERIHLIEPLAYEPFAFLMKRAHLILTDSGGIQEEAPSLAKPVLVLRTETERPEAVEAGTVKVVGVEADAILEATERLLDDRRAYERMAQAVNPYGDGRAAERIVKTLLEIHHAAEQKVFA